MYIKKDKIKLNIIINIFYLYNFMFFFVGVRKYGVFCKDVIVIFGVIFMFENMSYRVLIIF